MKALGKNICYQLEKHNLTQRYLAWKLGVTESAMSRWRRGEREPRVSVVYAMSKIFGCTMDELMGLPPEEPDKDKVSDLLYHIYSIQSPHLDMTGVIAKKYYCEELWKELFGKESELPGWMN